MKIQRKLRYLIYGVIFIICLSFTSCEIITAGETKYADEIVTEQNLNVGIEINDDGYYSFMGDSEISYDRNGEIKWICLHEPALLSYKVSSLWNNGVYVLSLSDCEHLKKVITDTCNELRKAGNDELAKELHVALSIIEDAGPYTGAST